MKSIKMLATAAVTSLAFALPSAHASLMVLQTFTGNYGYSADGFGSTSQSGTISAMVPTGSTVVAAYLYTSTFVSFAGAGGTLNGTTVNYTGLGVTGGASGLQAGRADVTSIVKPIIDAGLGGVYNFSLTETSRQQDGEALVIVYSNPTLATSTVSILDGFSATSGETTTLSFGSPLSPSSPGFQANLALGIGFSCCTQASTVAVNGITITNNAGNRDDGDAVADGALITVGGFNDPFSSALPSYADDHERYDISPYINAGDTSIAINTLNPSGDDNIFLAILNVTGEAIINEPPVDVPEPASLALMGLGMLGVMRFRRRIEKK